jgi:hypothetical protein
MNLFTLGIVFIIFLVGISKESVSQESRKEDSADNKFYVSISPLGLIDVTDGSSIRISTDAKLCTRFSISAEAGFYTSLGNFFSFKDDPRGLIIKPAVKYYFNKDKKFFGPFIALEYQYKQQAYRVSDSIEIDGIAPYYKSNYKMTRYVNCINAKYGVVSNLTKYVVLEWFVGAGVRFFNSTTELTTQEYDNMIQGEGHGNSAEASFSRTVGKYIYPNITAGVKLGLRII